MTSGGARVVSGPPPDPMALRRREPRDAAGWTSLPAEGRDGEPPEWPLSRQTGREREIWGDLWSRPQAVMWEKLDQRYEVALFARNLRRAEMPTASVELQKVVRQYLDSLGLSVAGMLRNRWKLAAPADAAAKAPAERRPSARTRLKVVGAPGEGA